MTTTKGLIKKIKSASKYGPRYLYCIGMAKIGLVSSEKGERYIEKYYRKLTPDQRQKDLEEHFLDKMGAALNLEDPKTFNEKIQWLKLYDSTPIKTLLADKVAVRDWVKEKIGGEYLIPVICVRDKFEEIPFDELPEEYVMQCNHGSGMLIIVRKDKPLDNVEAEKKFHKWLNQNFGLNSKQELHYRDIQPKIVITKYMENIAGDLFDYKIYCFDGVAKFVQIIKGRYGDERMSFYDLEWNKQNFYYTFGHMRGDEEFSEKPKNIDKVIKLAEQLADGFAYVRVDFYILEDGSIYFGEMTFTPMAGMINWTPKEADIMLGEMLILPKERYVLP